MQELYLKDVITLFRYYKTLAEKTFDQLDDDDLMWTYNESSNSIAVIVNHLWGNMKSRWTDFLNSDGEKKWRDRDGEFELNIQSRSELVSKWNEGWDCLFTALDVLEAVNLSETIYIRNMGQSVVEAINRQLAHYSSHIGQIVFIGKMIKGDEWKSLSISKGKSKEYNSSKFLEPKRNRHFTKDFIDEA